MSTVNWGSASFVPERAARAGRGGPPVPLIAVIGGCGGAGASTLAVSLAVTALRVRRRAVLFDADPLGGGLEPLVALGTIAFTPEGSRHTARTWPHDADTGGSESEDFDRRAADPVAIDRSAADPSAINPSAINPSAINPSALNPNAVDPRIVDLHGIDPPSGISPPRAQWPSQRGRQEPDLALVTWGGEDGERIPVVAMRNALRALRGTADLVVVDLPRCIDDSTQLVLSEATHILVVAPVSERAAIATARLLPKLALVGPRPQVVARLPARDELTAQEFAQLLGAPLAGVVKPSRGSLSRRGAPQQLGGRSASSLARFSRRLIERCAPPATASVAQPRPARRVIV